MRHKRKELSTLPHYLKLTSQMIICGGWIYPVGRAKTSNAATLTKSVTYVVSDGEIIEGVATVDESAITGESAPVIRESGGDRSAVTGGTTVGSGSFEDAVVK